MNRFNAGLPTNRDAPDRDIDTLRAGLSIARTADPMDELRNVADRDVARRNLDRTFETLHLVEGAPSEICDRAFGVCAHCGDDIREKPLDAAVRPHFCIACQECVEESGRGAPESENNAPYIVGGPRRGLFKRYRRAAERSPTVTMIA